ncbi:MAG: hypothetical protein KAJ92_05235 [Gammaproteobacteria bacterium]|nr:hypothetical protein [Gammaproteobacteria bacterium]
MKKSQFIFLLPLLLISACSSSDNSATQEASNTDAEKANPKISSDNPFSTQIDALNTAKSVGKAVQKSVDQNYQKLEDERR